MTTLNYKPESLVEMAQKARRYAKITGFVTIVYRDYDFDFPVYSFTNEKIFDSMVDNGEAESNWIEIVIYPSEL
jgi:hypothetical protein